MGVARSNLNTGTAIKQDFGWVEIGRFGSFTEARTLSGRGAQNLELTSQVELQRPIDKWGQPYSEVISAIMI